MRIIDWVGFNQFKTSLGANDPFNNPRHQNIEIASLLVGEKKQIEGERESERERER